MADSREGVQSALEGRYLYRVERAHGLPSGVRNQRDVQGRYRDVRYEAYCLVVELDGREAHPDHQRFRDRQRDNRLTVAGEVHLRYGWYDVAVDPCGTAGEVGLVLQRGGWDGTPHSCGPMCGLR